MAANNYYNTSYNTSSYPPSYHSRPYQDYDNGAPSPISRVPSTESSQYPPSTLHDNRSYDDRTYPYSHQTPSQSYQGASGRFHDDDIEDEGNSIPMSAREPKHDSTTSVAPILPVPPSDDPFVQDVKPDKRRGIPGTKDGWWNGQITWVVYLLTLAQIIVFIVELVRNGVLTGTPIEIHPSFNPMIGPSPYVLINMGARYQPCMHNMEGVQNSNTTISWPCPNATSTSGDDVSCSLSQLCGFSGVPNPVPNGNIHDKPAPNQWWRFIVPIFLHAGFIHIGFNLLLQLTLGRDIEKLIGSLRFILVYFAAGIFGFALGGNFAATGIASCGASGSLFGLLAIVLVDLLYTWRERRSPIKDLLFILVDVIIAFILGLLPGLDNFSHIGGFLMGLVLGICILRSPPAFRLRSIQSTVPFNPIHDPDSPRHSGRQDASQFEGEGLRGFIKAPLVFFQHRRGLWWVWWAVRAGALIGALIGFILLLKNFYDWRTTCGWCKYLSCLPIKNWCKVGNLDFTPTAQQNSTNSKRELLMAARAVFEPVSLVT